MLFIHCYLLKDFHQLPLPDDYCKTLPSEQRQRASTLQGKRLHEFYFGRLLLDFSFNQQSLNKHTSSWRIIENLNNAPNVIDTDKNTLASSISHSASWLGVAVCSKANTSDIGIDIESIREGWTFEKATLFCSESQLHIGSKIKDNAQRNVFFTRLWTQKEAFFKAGGEHIFNNQSSFNSNKANPENLLTQALDDNSIMSIYSHQKMIVNINHVSWSDNGFIIINE